ncbi:MAG: hypothetical protein IKT08_06890 [Bacteroidales bacterium]|nr:hypothetical protein [Bacteroidales bacterium]
MNEAYNPDWRYNNMTQTEIEDHVKARSSQLMSQTHFVTNNQGKRLKFKVTDKDIEHLVDDALHRAKGVLYISDLPALPDYFSKAVFVKTEKDTKKYVRNVLFHYYQIDINGRTLFLNFREDRQRRRTNLHSITTEIKKATS